MNLKELVKKIIPNRILQTIRLGKNNFYYYKIIKKISNKIDRLYIFGTAIHTNLGDHLITVAELKFLKENYPNKEIIEIPTEVYQVYRKKLIKNITQDSIIFINGGGWMGNLWVKEELLIQDMVNTFKNNRIVIFPQTIYFDSTKEPYDELIQKEIEVFEKHPNLLVTVRDRKSYNYLKDNYNNLHFILVPDIALYYYKYLEEYRKITKKKIVKFCLRNDREIFRDKTFSDKLINLFKNHNYSIGNIDTMFERRVSETDREEVLLNRLKDFAECSFIVTDRLHGMIFAYLVGTPCLVIDNKTRKVSGVYDEWLKDFSNIFPLFNSDNLDEIDKFVIENEENKRFCEFNMENFTTLRKEIKNG